MYKHENFKSYLAFWKEIGIRIENKVKCNCILTNYLGDVRITHIFQEEGGGGAILANTCTISCEEWQNV